LEVIPNIHRIDGLRGCNVYLVSDHDGLILIDTGMPGNAQKIIDYVNSINRKPSEITRIVLTHCHMDHVGSVHELKGLTNAKVAIHQDDAPYLTGEKSQPSPKGAVGIAFKAFSPFLKSKPIQQDVLLKDGDKVGRMTVIHTPGHTPGSIALYDSEQKLIFVGDTLRYQNGKVTGPPEHFTPDMSEALRSIKKISLLEFDLMLSGHGDPLLPNASRMVKEFSNSLQI
jgi:glyoxylase-like metal-dependent hydrolase (beta-lactamase superfamily II)